MTDRIARLRERSIEGEPYIDIERAKIVTAVYQEHEGRVSYPMLRALTFRAIFESKEIAIYPDELIVGDRGRGAHATPTYPEVCCHSLEDLAILNSREKVHYRVDDEVTAEYNGSMSEFWRGRSMREKLFAAVSTEWRDCYDAGIFTEFMEQRAPGHTAADGKMYRMGMRDFIADIDAKLKTVELSSERDAYDKREQLRAMRICAEAIICYGERFSRLAAAMAESESNPERCAELRKISEVCARVPANAPQNLHEALQMYWFVHVGVITELNTWDAYSPGRLDQHLLPFYEKALEDGEPTEEIRELLECFWLKFNCTPAPAKVGVTAAESGTYTDFVNINIGGLTPDGRDGANPVSLLLFDIIDELHTLQPSTNIQLSRKNPDAFLRRGCELIARGYGFPSVFNADAIAEELLRQGKSLRDAREGGASGCVEAGAFGKEAYILTGYLNLPKIFELTLFNGLDRRTGIQLGIKTGDAAGFKSFDELFEAFCEQLHYFVEVKVAGNNEIEALWARYMPAPFLSITVDDCIESGMDYNAGGARYNTSYIQGVGIGSLTDSAAAIKTMVFDSGAVTMPELLRALECNFNGWDSLRDTLLRKTPKYGNDDDAADDLMRRFFDAYYDEIAGRPNLRGGSYNIDMLPTTCHVYFGSVTGALPDGRLEYTPLSEGISPVQGVDVNGPTAVLKSASKMDHLRTGGTLLNMKFTPDLLSDNAGITALGALVRSYFRMDGHHVQFNVISRETLIKAQESPEEYRGLIVRVAGYSDYFANLAPELQNEIIARTENSGF